MDFNIGTSTISFFVNDPKVCPKYVLMYKKRLLSFFYFIIFIFFPFFFFFKSVV